LNGLGSTSSLRATSKPNVQSTNPEEASRLRGGPVEGFFSFLVGALLVALVENWQRLGDMAARTIVVVDQKPA